MPKKVSKKTLIQYESILSFMTFNEWYKSRDFMNMLDVKGRRPKILLQELMEKGYLIDDGATKGKRYKKIKEITSK